MELVKNIYFNTDKLIEGNTVKISYTGFFFQTNCEKVFLHFGFGNSWDGLKDIEMKKTALGFQASIELTSNEDLNMCFRNENEDWDNNFGQNFSFKVIKKPEVVALMVPEEDPFRISRQERLHHHRSLRRLHPRGIQTIPHLRLCFDRLQARQMQRKKQTGRSL